MENFISSFHALLELKGKIVDKRIIRDYLTKFQTFEQGLKDYCNSIGLELRVRTGLKPDDLEKIQTPFILGDTLITEVKYNYLKWLDTDDGYIKSSHKTLLYNPEVKKIIIYQFDILPKFSTGSMNKGKFSFTYYMIYILRYRRYLLQILIGLLLGTILQLLPPFLTRILIDKGVGYQDLDFMKLILLGLIVIQVGKVASQGIRDWISFYVGNRISIALLSDYVNRILTLQTSLIERVSLGDSLQRINDNKRVEQFLTNTFVNSIFMIFSLIVLSVIVAIFSSILFWVFFVGSLLFFCWNLYFLSLRRKIDVRMFQQNSDTQTLLIQMIEGRQDIKLQGTEDDHKLRWEQNNILQYKFNSKLKKIDIIQTSGGMLINELKNILLLYISAKLVMNNYFTIGMMLAIQYIIGQANQTIYKAAKIVLEIQAASLSLRRLVEIQELETEPEQKNETIKDLPGKLQLRFENVSFRYNSNSEWILKNITFTIPENKVTCIIGTSGSGKTTILKLLIKFYQPSAGTILVSRSNLKHFNSKWWRNQCGGILQDSQLFEDSILNNIVGLNGDIDFKKVINAVTLTNIKNDIESLPNGYQEIIGNKGVKFSPGQKQRILLARLIYRNPKVIILDEATSSLDPINEALVLSNLFEFFKNKTVIMVTHNLKTVKSADKLIILEKGKIVENGNPKDLLEADSLFAKMHRRPSFNTEEISLT